MKTSIFLLVLLIGSDAIGHTIYVSPDGSDANPGTFQRPFATIEGARDEIRQLKKKGSVPQGQVTVWLREGIYPVHKMLKLESQDSGTMESPIVYRAMPNEKVYLNGGVKIPASSLKPVKDQAILDRIINKGARAKILCADLKSLGVSTFGDMRHFFWIRTGRMTKGPIPPELVWNHKFLPLARWPNKDTIRLGKVVSPGKVSGWAVQAGREVDQSDEKPSFQFDYDRPNFWKYAADIYVFGIFNEPWSPDYNRIATIDYEKKEFELTYDHVDGLKQNEWTWYYVSNLMEEIDMPGEWYIDRQAGMLYVWPPADPNTSDVMLTNLQDEYMIHLEKVSYVTFCGIIFELSRENGVWVEGGHDNLFAGCVFRHLGRDAIKIDGTRNGILSCDIYEMGSGGIWLAGGDRKTLTPGSNFAVNNHIYDFNKWQRDYTHAIWIEGVGNRAAHNLIHNSPQGAIDYSGNENIIEFNDIHHISLVYSDGGAIYVGAGASSRKNIIRHNFIHHLGLDRPKISGVYLDMAHCGDLVFGNVFYKVTSPDKFGTVVLHGGNDNIIENNVFVECATALYGSNFLNNWGSEWLDRSLLPKWKKELEDVNYTNPPYSERYPELTNFLNENLRKPSRNWFRKNVIWKCEQMLWEQFDLNIHKQDNFETDTNPGFEDAENMNFQLADNSIVYKEIPAFERIPFEKIGVYSDEYRSKLLHEIVK